MYTTTTMIQPTHSSPHTFLQKIAPHVDFRMILLISLTSLLLLSGLTMNTLLPTTFLMHNYSSLAPLHLIKTKATPTPILQWKTLYTFTAIGSKKTFPFSVPQNWRMLWSCGNSEQDYYSLTVAINTPDGGVVDPVAVITQCQKTLTSATVQEHTCGTVYLNVDSDSAWTIQVQVPASTSTKPLSTIWKTQQTLQGSDNAKTSTFTVPKYWQITWQCSLAGKNDIDGLFANLNRTNDTIADPGAINAICKNGNTTDWTQEYTAGTYSLNVFSNTSWTIQIQIPQ